MSKLERACEEARGLVEHLEQLPLDMDSALDAVRYLCRMATRQHSLIELAEARVRLANSEGNPILSAWVEDAWWSLRDCE